MLVAWTPEGEMDADRNAGRRPSVGGTSGLSSSTTTASLADKVRQSRLEAGLTQAQLAGGEVDPVTIHRIESGRVHPTRRVLSHIARRVGKPIRFFLEQGGPDEAEIDCVLLRARIRRAAGDLETAQRLFETAEALAVAASDASRTALARLEFAAARVQRRWTVPYESELAAAQTEAARFGHAQPVAQSRYALAVALHAKGDHARAQQTLIATLASMGDAWPGLRARCVAELICVALAQGEGSDALEAQLEEAMASLAPLQAAEMWEAHAIAAENNGKLSSAVNANQQALMLREALATKRDEAVTRLQLGQAARRRGRIDEAFAQIGYARAVAHEAGDALTEAQSLVALAELHTSSGRITDASNVLEQARAVFALVAQMPGSASPAHNGSGPAKPVAPLQVVPDAQHVGIAPALVSARRAANVEGPAAD